MIGKTAGIYSEDMKEFYGWYEITDTGDKDIKKGKQLDIWMETEEECFEWGVKKVKVQIIDAVGQEMIYVDCDNTKCKWNEKNECTRKCISLVFTQNVNTDEIVTCRSVEEVEDDE